MGVFCKWTRIEINCHNTKNQSEAHYQDNKPFQSASNLMSKLLQHRNNKAIYPKEHILKIVKVPKPMRMVWGSAIAYWLSGIINPAFVAVAVMIALFIPVLIADPYFPSQPED